MFYLNERSWYCVLCRLPILDCPAACHLCIACHSWSPGSIRRPTARQPKTWQDHTFRFHFRHSEHATWPGRPVIRPTGLRMMRFLFMCQLHSLLGDYLFFIMSSNDSVGCCQAPYGVSGRRPGAPFSTPRFRTVGAIQACQSQRLGVKRHCS